MACGILVPQPGIEPRLLQWKQGALITGPPGNPQVPFSICEKRPYGLMAVTVTKKLRYLEEAPVDFPGGPLVETPPAGAGDTGSISGPGRSTRC